MSRKRDTQETATAADVRAAAIKFLARREHAVQELHRKLAARGYPGTLLDEALTALQREGLLSETRFVEQFVESRVRRGSGPVKIRAELRERGVADELIEAALQAQEFNWNAEAAAVRVKRFGTSLPADFAERARQARFLQQRGFAMEHIRAALKGDVDDI